MSNCAATGAVTNTNTAISNSGQLARPAQAKTSAEANKEQPTPSVLALLGPCRRLKKSSSRARPQAPTNADAPPPASNALGRKLLFSGMCLGEAALDRPATLLG